MGSYVPNTLEERKKMLQEIGYSSIEDLFAHIPEEVKLKGELNIPNGKSEFEVRREMEQIAEKNQVFKTIFRGAGAYRHFIPAMVKNDIQRKPADGIYAISGRNQSGNLTVDLRISDDDLRPDRNGCIQCICI